MKVDISISEYDHNGETGNTLDLRPIENKNLVRLELSQNGENAHSIVVDLDKLKRSLDMLTFING